LLISESIIGDMVTQEKLTKVGLVELLHYIFALFMCFSGFSSRCPESQREFALLGQFATTDPECKV
jgi:hypothetical protein